MSEISSVRESVLKMDNHPRPRILRTRVFIVSFLNTQSVSSLELTNPVWLRFNFVICAIPFCFSLECGSPHGIYVYEIHIVKIQTFTAKSWKCTNTHTHTHTLGSAPVHFSFVCCNVNFKILCCVFIRFFYIMIWFYICAFLFDIFVQR